MKSKLPEAVAWTLPDAAPLKETVDRLRFESATTPISSTRCPDSGMAMKLVICGGDGMRVVMARQ